MANLTRDFFIALSNNKVLNSYAKKWGFQLGAEKFVAGTDVDSVVGKVKELNEQGICATLDMLGEFVSERSAATEAKDELIEVLERIHTEGLDCHVSIKLTKLGLEIDEDFCLENVREIAKIANTYDIFVNIDMEKYVHYDKTLKILYEIRKDYSNVGTVIQTYLYRTEEDLKDLKDVRLRIVKGAYKESLAVAHQTKEDIDRNFLKVAKERLLGDAFTSIATHDHMIISELKDFIKENNIDHDKFEFQMLYGFRTPMHYELAEEGYNFCTYIPFGIDWYAYFMRRLAERPQNINLVLKDTFYNEDNKLKKGPLLIGAIALSSFFIYKKIAGNKQES